jgi:hypothetical protein
VRRVIPSFTATTSSSGLIDALARDLYLFPKRHITGEVFADSLHGTRNEVRVAKRAIRVCLAVDGDGPVLARTLPRASVWGWAFGEEAWRHRRRREIPVAFDGNQVSLVGFGDHGSVDVSFHALHAKHPAWEQAGHETIGR